jgi:hypothetical protein
VDAAVNLIHERGVSWLAWCGLNTESDALATRIPNAVNVQGSDDYDTKVSAIQSFITKNTRVLVTKAKIAGFGLNLQHCSHMVFVGLSDSYETYYQCIPHHRVRRGARHCGERAPEGSSGTADESGSHGTHARF